MDKNPEKNNLSSIRKELITQNTELYELLAIQTEQLEKNKEILIQQNKELEASKNKLEKTEEKYKHLFTYMNEGLMICKLIFDNDNKPIDYAIIEVNPAFEKLTGISRFEALAKKASELFTIDGKNIPYIKDFSKVSLTREPIYFELYNEKIGKYFGNSVFSREKNQFNVIINDITERKNAEKELELNKFSMDYSTIFTFWMDYDGILRYVNKYSVDLLGYSKEEMIGKHFKQFFTKFNDEKWANFQKEIKLNKFYTIDTTLMIKDNGHIPVHITTRLLNFRGKEYIFTYAQDITEIKQTQKKLSQIEKQFQTLSDIAFDIIIIVDGDGVISYWNQSAEKHLGFSKNEALGADLVDLIVPDRMKVGYLNLLGALKENIHADFLNKTAEIILTRKDGIELTVEGTNSAIDIDGKIYCMGILRDITNRKALEDNLKQIRLQQEALLNSVPDYIWLKDKDGTFIEINKAFVEFLGLKKEEIIGKTVFDIFPENIAKELHNNDLDIYNNPKTKVLQEKFHIKGKNIILNEIIKSPILDEDQILGISGIARNIAERKKEQNKT